MKIVITQREAIDAYRKLNKISEEENIEIEQNFVQDFTFKQPNFITPQYYDTNPLFPICSICRNTYCICNRVTCSNTTLTDNKITGYDLAGKPIYP